MRLESELEPSFSCDKAHSFPLGRPDFQLEVVTSFLFFNLGFNGNDENVLNSSYCVCKCTNVVFSLLNLSLLKTKILVCLFILTVGDANIINSQVVS